MKLLTIAVILFTFVCSNLHASAMLTDKEFSKLLAHAVAEVDLQQQERQYAHELQMADKYIPLIEKGLDYLVFGLLPLIAFSMFLKKHPELRAMRLKTKTQLASIAAETDKVKAQLDTENIKAVLTFLDNNKEKLTDEQYGKLYSIVEDLPKQKQG
ncbi:MAG: hypothetical protein AAF988_04955 [Pseudomonadota bacterium]